jgi:alpha-galactosidase
MDNKVLEILKNKELIAIDQDKRGLQAKRIYSNALQDILVKPLENRELALCFLNKSNSTKQMSMNLAKLHNEVYVDLPITKAYEVTDLWENKTEILDDDIVDLVQAHGVKVYRIKAI